MYKLNNFHQKMDAQSILLRAPKLIINNIDLVNQILPKDQIYINAFGQISDIQFFNKIPNLMLNTLGNL